MASRLTLRNGGVGIQLGTPLGLKMALACNLASTSTRPPTASDSVHSKTSNRCSQLAATWSIIYGLWQGLRSLLGRQQPELKRCKETKRNGRVCSKQKPKYTCKWLLMPTLITYKCRCNQESLCKVNLGGKGVASDKPSNASARMRLHNIFATNCLVRNIVVSGSDRPSYLVLG